MLSISPLASDVATLRDPLDGSVVLPGDDGWDAARQAWNLAVDQRPAFVALPESAADVQAIVDFARTRGLRIAMQGTGHNASPDGPARRTRCSSRRPQMRGVEIDEAHCVARVEAGALWIDVTAPASEVGLAPLAGSSPDVGVVGYTLGGGLSWLGRRYGLAANRLLSVEVVTADGRLVRASRHENAELFWALRGGGGNFGAVVAIEFELIPMRKVYAGMLHVPVGARPRGHAGLARVDRPRAGLASPPRAGSCSSRRCRSCPDFLRGRSDRDHRRRDRRGRRRAAEELLAPLRALGPEMDTFAESRPSACPTSTWTPRTRCRASATRRCSTGCPAEDDRRDRRRGRAGLRQPAADGRAAPHRRRARALRGRRAEPLRRRVPVLRRRRPDGPRRRRRARGALRARRRRARAAQRRAGSTSTSPSAPPTRSRSTARRATRGCAASRPRSTRSRSSAATTRSPRIRSRPRPQHRAEAPPARMRAGHAALRLHRGRLELALALALAPRRAARVRALGAEAGLRAHEQLVVRAGLLARRREHRAEPAAEEADRDRHEPRERERRRRALASPGPATPAGSARSSRSTRSRRRPRR